MKRTPGFVDMVSLILTMALLIFIGVIAFRSTIKLIAVNQQEEHPLKILLGLEDVFSDVKDVTAALRDYVISGAEAHLAMRDEASKQIERKLKVLREALAAQSEQRERFARFELMVARSLALPQEIIEARRDLRIRAAIEKARLEESSRLINQMGQVVRDIEAEERRQFEARQAASTKSALRTLNVFYLTGAVALLIAALLHLGLHRELARRRRAEARLQQANEGLGTRVRERTEELVQANACLQNETAERKLAELQARMSLAAAKAGAWSWDMNTGVVQWSPETYQIFGVERFEGTAEAFGRLLHPEDTDKLWATIDAAIVERKPYEAEYRLVRPDGEMRWIANRGRADYDDAGNPLRVLGIAMDITARKRIEEERAILLEQEQAARAEAQAANQAKDEFLTIVSHELRSPLNAMFGWTRILRDQKADDPQVLHATTIIERSARQQLQLIEDLLDTARVISGKLRIETRPIELVSVIFNALDVVRPAAEAKRIDLISRLNPSAGQITGDPDRLQQVVWNLLSNAIKFTPDGGRVEVRLDRADPHVQIRVSDTGKGIEAGFLPHIFDRFRQADSSAARRYGGLGLGLSLVKQLVELHGGTVSASSAGEGQGAIFTVKLPMRAVYTPQLSDGRRPACDKGAQVEASCGVLALAGVRVLVVDDEEGAREMIATTLHDYGAQVQAVASGADVIELLVRQGLDARPDVLVCDIGLPGENGYAVLRRVRTLPVEQGGAIPAVAVTAYARVEDRLRALQAGFQMHVAKPVEPAELITVLASVVGKLDGNYKSQATAV
jgi:PAS domain S-box-containing protein